MLGVVGALGPSPAMSTLLTPLTMGACTEAPLQPSSHEVVCHAKSTAAEVLGPVPVTAVAGTRRPASAATPNWRRCHSGSPRSGASTPPPRLLLRRRRADMAHIRTDDTTERRKNKVVKTYGVVWREPDRDQFGPIPVNPDRPRGRSDARLAGDLLSAARHTTGTSALAEQKRRGAAVWVRRARLARRAGGEGQPAEAHAAHGQATSLAPADH